MWDNLESEISDLFHRDTDEDEIAIGRWVAHRRIAENQRNQARYQTREFRAWRQAYRQRQDIKARERAYNQARYQTAAYRAQLTAYRQRPDVRQKARDRSKARYARQRAQAPTQRVTC